MNQRLQAAELRAEPFLHTTASSAVPADLCALTLDWMEAEAPWMLRIADFYSQWEMHLATEILPISLRAWREPAFIAQLSNLLLAPLTPTGLRLIEVTAHKLVPGQTIRVHNDYREDGETHRLLVQLNRGWRDEQGGLLMLFSSVASDDVRRVIRPLHRSAMAFPISSSSFHAVSTIHAGERYTLVYSFRGAPN
jgi:2OG-Fe(II) oxygenase superfamily